MQPYAFTSMALLKEIPRLTIGKDVENLKPP